ncbi:hypothetical protein OX459_12390 [Janthinobacterium sp. SUN026]|uniref:hypothetical protein n=1 Tax=Janthinobacterium sp. SUN026 TaxID=3002438 RepID=UPI0025B1CB86|nr:hypothetical protein [Janthinobacterium sp. SUN026]MDN2672192.1 hypothetical protein [Janthinobacterium sp. SUN026]
MLTNWMTSGRADACRGNTAFRRGMARDTAGAVRPALSRLQALAYLALLLAVLPAVSCIAMGRAGVPVLFSTACGVVSCAAGGHAL